MIRVARDEGFAIEFSSGMPHAPSLVESYRKAECDRLPHNYFPAPHNPFVLNLASQRRGILERSRAHCLHGLALAAEAGSSFYSAHAGFLSDPSPEDLGGPIAMSENFPRSEYWMRFLESVEMLAADAARLGIRFLIENHVVVADNLAGVGDHAMLCASPEECLDLVDTVRNPALGLLLDTGHLKVSAETLGFSRSEFVQKTESYITAVHHSDNDGKADTNMPLTEDYWFLEFMPALGDAMHVLETRPQEIDTIRRQRWLLESAIANRGARWFVQ